MPPFSLFVRNQPRRATPALTAAAASRASIVASGRPRIKVGRLREKHRGCYKVQGRPATIIQSFTVYTPEVDPAFTDAR